MRFERRFTGLGKMTGSASHFNDWENAGARLPTDGKLVSLVEVEQDTRVASARRRTKPLREGVVGLQLNGQYSRATVTNPDRIPADTNANLRR
jgi:hypothetical protein